LRRGWSASAAAADRDTIADADPRAAAQPDTYSDTGVGPGLHGGYGANPGLCVQ
jgi:hypothetical protein